MTVEQGPRIALDSNVWRYVLDASAGSELAARARAASVRVVVAPAVVHEALRTKDKRLRERLAELLTRKAWTRLMPEAYTESMELIRAIRRFRPDWLADKPDNSAADALRSDWETRSPHGHWGRMRREPHSEAAKLAAQNWATVESAAQQAFANREGARKARVDWTSLDVEACWYTMIPGEAAWSEGGRVECWRVDSADWYASQLFDPANRPNPTAQWLDPFLAPRLQPSRTSWMAFWFREVPEDEMSRNLIRWLARLVQSTRRTNRGTPIDNQLASYLPDCDILVTADRAFAAVIDRLRPYVPGHVAKSHLVSAGDSGVEDLYELVRPPTE